MSTSLRSELAQASNPKAVADGIANLFGEDVVIFDVDGLEVARAGQNINTATDCGIVLALEEQKRPLGALEISQRNTVFDEAMCRRIEQIAAPVLTLYLDGGARVGMVAHLIAGPEDGVHVSPMEAREGHAMLDALGFAASGVYMPFAMKLKSVANAMPAIVSMIDDFESNGGCESICLLEGDLMIGFLAAQDSGGDVSVFSDRCLHALTQVAANRIRIYRAWTRSVGHDFIDGRVRCVAQCDSNMHFERCGMPVWNPRMCGFLVAGTHVGNGTYR